MPAWEEDGDGLAGRGVGLPRPREHRHRVGVLAGELPVHLADAAPANRAVERAVFTQRLDIDRLLGDQPGGEAAAQDRAAVAADTDAGADVEHGEGIDLAAGAEPRLGGGHGMDVVVDQHGQAKLPGQEGLQREVDAAAHQRGVDAHAPVEHAVEADGHTVAIGRHDRADQPRQIVGEGPRSAPQQGGRRAAERRDRHVGPDDAELDLRSADIHSKRAAHVAAL